MFFRSSSVDQELKKSEPKKSENELHWEELVKSMSRPLNLCDLDFTDLNSDDEKDVLAPRGLGAGVPPPPPPIGIGPPIAPSGHIACPPAINIPTSNPIFNYNNTSAYTNGHINTNNNNSLNNSFNSETSHTSTIKKNKKTVKKTTILQIINFFISGKIVLERSSRGYDSNNDRQDNMG